MKTINKFLAVILSLALFISVCPLGVFTFTASAATYSGSCGENLTWEYDDSTYTLTISGTGAMNVYDCYYDYDYSSAVTTAPWKSYYNAMKTLVIGSGVTFIGDYAFYGCSGLTSVNLPGSVTSIGKGAFYSCTGLTSITIPDSVTSIGTNAFYYCTGLTSITIPDSVTSMGDWAFEGCYGLTSVIIGNSVTSIGWCAFEGCYGLTNVIIGNSVTTIGEGAFGDCYGLTSITIPNGVTSIGDCAFDRCSSLTSITIPDSVTSIGDKAFRGCTGLTDVYYTGTEQKKNDISIGSNNSSILNAMWHYYSTVSTVNAKNATCTKPGYTGDTGWLEDGIIISYGKEIPALGHKKAAAVKENEKKATYTKAGSYDSVVYCSVCKNELSRKKVTIPMKVGTFKITYKLNGGKNGKNPATFKTNATVTLKNPTRKGYKFGGWYTDSKFKKKITKITKGTAKNITLYAKWSKVTYKITYKLNKGKNGKNPKTYTVTTKTFTLKNATRKGYTFKGWYSDAKFKKKVTKIAKGTTGNKTLYAKWAKKK